MPRGPRGPEDDKSPLVDEDPTDGSSDDSDEREIQRILSDFSEGWLDSGDEDDEEGEGGVGLPVPMQVN